MHTECSTSVVPSRFYTMNKLFVSVSDTHTHTHCCVRYTDLDHSFCSLAWAWRRELSQEFPKLIYCKLNYRFIAMTREFRINWFIRLHRKRQVSPPPWVNKQRLAFSSLLLKQWWGSEAVRICYFWWLIMINIYYSWCSLYSYCYFCLLVPLFLFLTLFFYYSFFLTVHLMP